MMSPRAQHRQQVAQPRRAPPARRPQDRLDAEAPHHRADEPAVAVLADQGVHRRGAIPRQAAGDQREARHQRQEFMPEGQDSGGAGGVRSKVLLPEQRPARGAQGDGQVGAKQARQHGLGLSRAQQRLHRRAGSTGRRCYGSVVGRAMHWRPLPGRPQIADMRGSYLLRRLMATLVIPSVKPELYRPADGTGRRPWPLNGGRGAYPPPPRPWPPCRAMCRRTLARRCDPFSNRSAGLSFRNWTGSYRVTRRSSPEQTGGWEADGSEADTRIEINSI